MIISGRTSSKRLILPTARATLAVWALHAGPLAAQHTANAAWATRNIHAIDDTSATQIRRVLLTAIWNTPRLPSRQADARILGVPLESVLDGPTLRSIATAIRFEVRVADSLHQVVLLRPSHRSGTLVLVADGHTGAARLSVNGPVARLVQAATERGADVLYLQLPLGSTRDHDALGAEQTRNFHPLRYFLEPAVVALNEYLATEPAPLTIVATGISGGGWLTVMLSALDTRIRASFPVAGSLPMALRTPGLTADQGDWEQRLRGLTWDGVHQVEYLDLYLMGASDGRTQVQINNELDTCCFAGKRHESYAGLLTSINDHWRFVADRFIGHGVGTSLESVIAPAFAPPLGQSPHDRTKPP